MSFWNDLLRNDDGVSYFSEKAGARASRLAARRAQVNLPYDEFVASC